MRIFRFVTENSVEEKIIERAERKLYTDAVVIQQGRLLQQNRKLSKDELDAMVRFGADTVFKSEVRASNSSVGFVLLNLQPAVELSCL